MTRYNAATRCSQVIFTLLNCVCVALGAGLAGVGTWLVYLGRNTHDDYYVFTGDRFVSGAVLILIAGALTIVVSILGIMGACGMWRPLLVIYCACASLLALTGLAVGVIGFVFWKEASDKVKGRMYGAVEDYRPGPTTDGYREEVNDAIAYVQGTFKCCGVNSSLDWFLLNPESTNAEGNKPPGQCLCDLDEDSHCASFNFTYQPPESVVEQDAIYDAWDRGCLSFVQDNLKALATSLSVLGLAFAAIEVFSIALAVGFIICITKRNTYTFV